MNIKKEIKDLEKNQRLSARAIPTYSGLLVVAAAALWIVARFFTISLWVTIIVLGITAFTLLGDVCNYLYCGRKLKALKRNHIGS